MLLSPAAVDLGGKFILPREADYKKITQEQIENIYREVLIPKEYFEFFYKKLNEEFKIMS